MKSINKNGISLIVLIITVMVMIILAATAVITINNSGVLRRANNAVDATEYEEVKQLLALAWAEAQFEGNQTIEDIEQAIIKKTQGIDLSSYDYEVTEEGVIVTQVVKRSEESRQMPKLNEYGFYYDVVYNLPLYLGKIGPGAVVFHEDGSAEAYMALAGVNWGINTCNISYEAGSIIYEKGKITFPDTYFVKSALEVKNDGLMLATTSEVFECAYKYPGELRYNKTYEGTDIETNMPFTAVFKDEKTVEFTYYETADSTAPTKIEVNIHLEGDGHMIKIVGVTYDGIKQYGGSIGGVNSWGSMEHAFGYVSLDGKQLIITSNTTLQFSGILTLVQEHVND